MTISLVAVDMDGGFPVHRAIAHSLLQMPPLFFNEVILCSPTIDLALDWGRTRWVPTDFLPCKLEQRQLYSIWKLRELACLVNSDYALLIQDDGFILNGDKWSSDFLMYDYIGAPWDSQTSGGNGAFNLRSRNFMQATQRCPYPFPRGANCDWHVCHDWYMKLAADGIRFAPPEVAARFSLELDVPQFKRSLSDVFGFHGRRHMNQVEKTIANDADQARRA